MRFYFIGAFLLCSLAATFSQQKSSIITSSAYTKSDTISKSKTKSYSLSEVSVSSLRAGDKSPIAYTNIDRETLSKSNLGQDIPYLLALTPSFVANSDAGAGIGYTGFRIRGTDANRINVTVNGVPLNDSESHGVFFVNMPDFASSLSSVQVQRGVGTSTNGAAAFGASINMQTSALNTKPSAEFSSTLGSFGTNKNTLKAGTGLLKNNLAFDARLSNITSKGYMDRAAVNMKSFYLSGGYFTEKTVVKLVAFGGEEKTYQAWNGVSGDSLLTNRTYNELGRYTDPKDSTTKFYNNQTDNYKQTHFQLHWLQQLNSDWSMNSTLHYTKGLGYYEEYKPGSDLSRYAIAPILLGKDTLKQTDLVRRKWLDNDFLGFTYALNYKTEKLQATFGGAASGYYGHHFGNVIWAQNVSNLDVANDFYRSKSVKEEANIFAKVNGEVIDKLSFMADIQFRTINYRMSGNIDRINPVTGSNYDLTQTHIFNFFNPKLGFNYQINSSNELYISSAISNREPTRTNYTESASFDKPKSEWLLDNEFGYRFQSSRCSFGANAYYMKYRDQLILTGKVSEIGELLTSNIADSYRAGIEFSMGAKFTNWMKWDGNFTLSENKIINFTEVVDAYDVNWNPLAPKTNFFSSTDIAYSPNIISNSMFTFNYKAFECGLNSSYVGKQYFDNSSDNARSINAYFVNNLNLRYSLMLMNLTTVNFALMVNNLFDAKYEANAWTWYSCYVDGVRVNDSRFFPQAGRNFLAMVTIKF